MQRHNHVLLVDLEVEKVAHTEENERHKHAEINSDPQVRMFRIRCVSSHVVLIERNNLAYVAKILISLLDCVGNVPSQVVVGQLDFAAFFLSL